MGALCAADLDTEKPYGSWELTFVELHTGNHPCSHTQLSTSSRLYVLQFPSQQRAYGIVWRRKLEICVLGRTMVRRQQASTEIPLSKWKSEASLPSGRDHLSPLLQSQHTETTDRPTVLLNR